jgi:hypothetical protein
MRYKNSKFKSDEGGNKIFTTTLYPRVKHRSTDTFLVMVEKTRLDHLAHKFYENANHWWVIAIANNIKGTMYINPGTQVRIPRDIGSILHDYNKINKR